MLDIAVISCSLLIAIIDIRKHRIYNSHLAIFACPLILNTEQTTLPIMMASVISALLISALLRIGGGDFKLFSLLAFTHGSLIATQQYFTWLFAAVSILVLFYILKRGNFRGSVPLAPALLAPFVLLYLGI